MSIDFNSPRSGGWFVRSNEGNHTPMVVIYRRTFVHEPLREKSLAESASRSFLSVLQNMDSRFITPVWLDTVGWKEERKTHGQ